MFDVAYPLSSRILDGAKEGADQVRLSREYFAKQGSKGGKKAADAMTPEQRKKRARKAAKARYAKKGGQP